MDRWFEGKVALVTGAAGGIGRATAVAFAKEGANLVLADLNEEGGRETAELVKREGAKALFRRTDVTRAVDVESTVQAAMDTFGRLDAAFNNAGISLAANVVECSEEDWDRVLAVNLKSVYLGMKYEIPAMIKNGGGAIVNTASIAGMKGSHNLAAYAASKHAVVGLTRSAANDFAAQNIRVNTVLPGSTETPMLAAVRAWAGDRDLSAGVPLARTAEPHEQADVVVWLCSPRSSYVVGVALPVDGGLLA